MPSRQPTQWLITACLALCLVACGGGGGGGSGGGTTPSGGGSSGGGSNGGSSAPGTGGGTNNGGTNNGGSTPTTPTPVTYKVLLTWSAPAVRADGSALPIGAIAGYRIYYVLDGSAASDDTAVSVAGGTTTRYQLNLTKSGTYTFAITAVDQTGVESNLSVPASITVN